MHFMNVSRWVATHLTAIGLIATASFAGNLAFAETIFTVNGIDVDSAVVDLYFENRLGQPGSAPTPTPEQRTTLMAELRDIYLLSTQDIGSELAQEPRLAAQIQLQTHGSIAQAVAGDYLASVEVSEEEILAVYAEQIKLAPQLQFKARHILVASQGEAIDLITELDGGADFEELAREKSTGPSAPTGGDLGWFSPNQMVPPFSNAVAAMEDGEYTSEPVQTQFGWHVILREESRDSEPPTLESAREAITQQVQQKKLQAYIASLREAAKE
ncbi:Peptidyl-prolyl cis-trans isomerase C [uncultured Woeseiaceae bacterium]|uniref:peptidylprolyl isomerase n=1 Tax=uncultured Woeseiaceae bacterium TaxID=1983305 RepID=A0A7D9D3B4_9GAMM|nr:Peptidyl-prolyl cis-trans isomerase C [uncultured Woeseiaceae bacterium]